MTVEQEQAGKKSWYWPIVGGLVAILMIGVISTEYFLGAAPMAQRDTSNVSPHSGQDTTVSPFVSPNRTRELGSVHMGQELAGAFTFTNSSPSVREVLRVTASCSCVEMQISTKMLAHRETATLEWKIPAGNAGHHQYFVTVTSDLREESRLVFEISFDVQDVIYLEPRRIYFSKAQVENGHVRLVRLRGDPRYQILKVEADESRYIRIDMNEERPYSFSVSGENVPDSTREGVLRVTVADEAGVVIPLVLPFEIQGKVY